MTRLLLLAVFLFGVAVLPGCGQRGSVERAPVTGRVTLDGNDIVEGVIGFDPSGDTKGPVTGTGVRNGRYALSSVDGPVVGKNRVEIRAIKNTGRKVQAPMAEPNVLMDEAVEVIPDCYNTKSTIECNVKPGENRLDFHLETKTTSVFKR